MVRLLTLNSSCRAALQELARHESKDFLSQSCQVLRWFPLTQSSSPSSTKHRLAHAGTVTVVKNQISVHGEAAAIACDVRGQVVSHLELEDTAGEERRVWAGASFAAPYATCVCSLQVRTPATDPTVMEASALVHGSTCWCAPVVDVVVDEDQVAKCCRRATG